MMVQMLFSGMFVPFVNVTRKISYFTSGRWGYESFGTISNITKYGVLEPSESFFQFNNLHLLSIWTIMIIVSLLFLILSVCSIRITILNKKNYGLVLLEEKSKVKRKKIYRK